ncbi:response regulator [Streptomyces sp. BI20]|uniref:response regulator n=1 Tax=Streptomyces sp. BI20 TaxID=3403460 RepID=UPI003C7476BF
MTETGAAGLGGRRIRVLLVDDDALVRAGLRLMLGGAPDLLVVGEAADGAEVAGAVAAHAPDVVLMDVRMPGVDGIAATTALRARSGAPEVLVLTTFHTDAHVWGALRAGAAGFLVKDTPPAEIVAAIRAVVAGEPALSPAVTRRLMERVAAGTGPADRAARARARLAELGEREREVARAVGRGLSNAQIAAELHLAVPTVKTHVSRLLTRWGLGNRVQIALLVHDAGLSDPGW